MSEHPKIKHRLKLKRKHKSGHSFTFLRHKRASPNITTNIKSKEKSWENLLKKLEENTDLFQVKNNFQHFFHLNLEENIFDRELGELEKIFMPSIFWRLINYSYFQDNCLKEKVDNCTF